MAKERVCMHCRIYVKDTNICPICKKSTFANVAYGLFILIDPEKSFLAKKAGFNVKGTYALKVR